MRAMKYVLALILVLAPATVMAGTIVGSDHDFSGKSFSGGEICVVCHTPHHADTSVTDAPLWNHAVTTATFTLYSSGTLNATLGQPDGISKLCLSCHDGTVAVDAFGGAAGGSEFVTGHELIGTDLSNDHPISFTYDATLATDDGELAAPVSTAFVDAGSRLPLFNAKLECATCHDVHNTDVPAGAKDLLRVTTTKSDLCLTCHVK